VSFKKLSAEDARWEIREAAWTFEERVLWRASDASRAALRRALRAVSPLQRLIQTKLVWPLSDRLDDYGTGTRTALATLGVVAALGAGTAGVLVAGSEGGAPTAAAHAAVLQPADAGTNLRGVPPDFVADPNAGATTTAAPAAKPADPPAPGASGPDAPPAQVAWNFAQAFVLYEVGKVDDKAEEAFKQSATRPLAAALSKNPPRLPEGAKVPEAKVLNVVEGEQTGKEMTVSVSLLRLEAASELRLTLRETKRGWLVAGVLG
jgi:hypothetical protein